MFKISIDSLFNIEMKFQIIGHNVLTSSFVALRSLTPLAVQFDLDRSFDSAFWAFQLNLGMLVTCQINFHLLLRNCYYLTLGRQLAFYHRLPKSFEAVNIHSSQGRLAEIGWPRCWNTPSTCSSQSDQFL